MHAQTPVLMAIARSSSVCWICITLFKGWDRPWSRTIYKGKKNKQ